MRIAIVSDFFLDYVGGAQSSITEQRLALEAAGHEVRVIAISRRLRHRTSHIDGGDLRVRPLYTIPGAEFPVVHAGPWLVAALHDFFVDAGVDVVHLQTEFGLAHAAAEAARDLGIPVVLTVHTFYWQSTGRWQGLLTPLLRRFVEKAVRQRLPRNTLTHRGSDNVLRNLTLSMASRVDHVISPSAHQAADLVAAGVLTPLSIVPNPIVYALREPHVLVMDPGVRPRLVWIARCEPEKRPLVFAAAAIEALRQTDDAFDVDIVGDGSELALLRQRTAEHPAIRVHGNVPREKVTELIDDASLVVLTSFGFDNQPMTIAEAISRYRGVLLCDPQLREGLDHSGVLTPSPNTTDIASAIAQLVRDPERLVALSEGAKVDSAVFAGPAYVSRIEAAYRAAGA